MKYRIAKGAFAVEVIECISTRRSIRSYTDEEIPNTVIEELLRLGTKAATGSNQQPWGFVVIKDKGEIEKLSAEIRDFLIENFEKYPYFQQYEKMFQHPKFDVLNRSNCVILMYGNTKSHWAVYDTSLAAGNIMLAAHAQGIGSCWIGFAEPICNTKEFKAKYNVSEEFDLVCTLTIGYTKKSLEPSVRKDPLIFHFA